MKAETIGFIEDVNGGTPSRENPVVFLRDERRIDADIEHVKRTRARLAAQLEEFRLSLYAVMEREPTFEDVVGVILEQDGRRRRIAITKIWLDRQALPITIDLEHAIDGLSVPEAVTVANVHAASFLTEDRDREIITLYWVKGKKVFEAPRLTEVEKMAITERHTWYAQSPEAHAVVNFLNTFFTALNLSAKKTAKQVSPATLDEVAPWAKPFAHFPIDGTVEVNVDALLKRGKQSLVAGEMPFVEVKQYVADNLLRRIHQDRHQEIS